MKQGFSETLLARGPHPSLGEHAQTYARVIGSWRGQLHNHMLGRSVPPVSIEAHFAWVLEGRAVQDVWITPARDERGSAPAALDWYGSTLRVFEPSSSAWRSAWTDPVSGLRIEILGRRQGDDIVQIGTRGGRPIRWTFSQIRADSFVWQGHILNVDGETWDLEVDIQFRRVEG
ncbi:MAG TPA: hypothetical protein VFS67_01205 [Polyangiaceae bacterium]|jgi:hypothetical protein|nr:hypothetical protein [Polyangiaceae bacterium]